MNRKISLRLNTNQSPNYTVMFKWDISMYWLYCRMARRKWILKSLSFIHQQTLTEQLLFARSVQNTEQTRSLPWWSSGSNQKDNIPPKIQQVNRSHLQCVIWRESWSAVRGKLSRGLSEGVMLSRYPASEEGGLKCFRKQEVRITDPALACKMACHTIYNSLCCSR